MVKYLSHTLFEEPLNIYFDGKEVPVIVRVSFMRYDEEGHLFFPVYVFTEDNENLYMSVKYRMYAGGTIAFVRSSGDYNDEISSQIDEYFDSLPVENMIIDFLQNTTYNEIMPCQAC